MKYPKTILVAVNERGLRIGQDHHQAKLTDHEVGLVFQLVRAGFTSREIAGKLRVSLDLIKKIRCGQRRCQTVAGYKLVHVKRRR